MIATLHACLPQVHKAKLRKQRFSRKQRKQAQAFRQHMVAPQEDIGSIARKHNILVADIERLNTGSNMLLSVRRQEITLCRQACQKEKLEVYSGFPWQFYIAACAAAIAVCD